MKIKEFRKGPISDDQLTSTIVIIGLKSIFSSSLNLDSGCIGFKCCKHGGGDVPFGHLAPVIQFVTPSRSATPIHAELYCRKSLFYLT